MDKLLIHLIPIPVDHSLIHLIHLWLAWITTWSTRSWRGVLRSWCISRPGVLFVILGPPPRIIVPIISSTIPANRYKLPSSFRRRRIVESFIPTLSIRKCNNYKQSTQPKKYLIGRSLDKYIKYDRLGRYYNLALFSLIRWARIEKQRKEKA